jgi:hypothetical protein
MIKLKKIFTVLLAAMIICFITVGSFVSAFADVQPNGQSEEQNTTENIVDPDISSNYGTIDELVAGFKAYLKNKYGDDYEYCYNLIIERWGSVEAYLMSFGDKLPDEYKSGWEKFVGWLADYSVVWAPALAVILVVLLAVIGKKQFNKLVEKIVNVKLSPIVKELNTQSDATVAIIHAQKALLGTNERFVETVKELEYSEKGLKNE